jgi:hypothetical protein
LPLTRENLHPPGGRFAPKPVEESNHFVKGWFRIAWEEFGGRGMFGLPLSEPFIRLEDQRVVQYFEAAVLEYHPEKGGGTSWGEMTRGARALRLIEPLDLGHGYTAGREFPKPEYVPEDARYFSETGHTIRGDFRTFYEGSHGEWRLGAPISEELTEEIYGIPTKVQYFQKGRLEVSPETGVIRFGQLGRWAYELHCTPQESAP